MLTLFYLEIIMKGIIAGVIAGVAGALVWAGIAVSTGYEIGWLAWGIGAAVGAAVAWGSVGSKANGSIAVVIAVVAILGGKFASVEMSISKEVKAANEDISKSIDSDDEYVMTWLADVIVASAKDKGKRVEWPAGVTAETASEKKDYPGEIWAMTEIAWSTMSEEKKASFKSEVQEQVQANVDLYMSSVRGEGFMASFSPFDIVFFFLAISTAYRIASKEDGEVVVENEVDERNIAS
jgi:hypothetical protein